jgi:hypothetical protein
MPMLADSAEVVIGVDTHKHTHTASVVVVATGATTATMTVAATPAGYQQLLELAGQHGRPRVWAIESTGGYGAGLTRFLHAITSRWSSWIGPSGPPAATGPSPTRWMRPGPPARLWAVTSWPSPGRPGHGPRCRCGWRPAVRRSRPPVMPNASSTPWSLRHLRSYGNGSGPTRPASWWLPAPGCGSTPAGTWRPAAPRPRWEAWPVGSGS